MLTGKLVTAVVGMNHFRSDGLSGATLLSIANSNGLMDANISYETMLHAWSECSKTDASVLKKEGHFMKCCNRINIHLLSLITLILQLVDEFTMPVQAQDILYNHSNSETTTTNEREEPSPKDSATSG